MGVSRRWFIGGAASFGALQGCRLLSGSSPCGGRPNVTFGVVSDIHIIAENVDSFCGQGNTRTLRHAFRWFDRQGVDGVIIAGDMADAGLVSQLQCVADAWNAVFPGNRSALDGRPVEKLFIYGNHDWEGFNYGYSIFGRPSAGLGADHIQKAGLGRVWEEVFGEPYAPVYRKTVKGYDFVGAHWDGTTGANWKGMPAIKPWFAENGKSLDPSRPFFFFQHPHPKDTCYGSWAWGHDSGLSTEALTPFPNAIAFSGHSHYSLLDERTVWQGAFTSIGTGSLRYEGEPYDEIPGGFENTAGGGRVRPDADKLMPSVSTYSQRSGLLLRVYDDAIVIERRDFMRDVPLGPDWTLPLPAAESKPFAFAAHSKRLTAPEFPAKAAVAAALGTAQTRANAAKAKAEKDKAAKFDIPAVRLTFPAAVQTFASRVWRYEVVAEDANGKRLLVRHVLSPDFHLPLSEAQEEVSLAVAKSDLPAGGEVRFRVTPHNCMGKAGAAIVSSPLKI